jgi:hypothetical protein
MIRERPDEATMTAFPFRKAHFIGLAGVGMSATAILLRDSSVAVTGSDEAIYPPISQVLAREEFACQAPYAAQNIPDDDDLIVIGKNARLVPSENNEVSMSVPAPFVWRCLSGSAVAPFPHPSSNRTCRSPASGSRTRLTSTTSMVYAPMRARAR